MGLRCRTHGHLVADQVPLGVAAPCSVPRFRQLASMRKRLHACTVARWDTVGTTERICQGEGRRFEPGVPYARVRGCSSLALRRRLCRAGRALLREALVKMATIDVVTPRPSLQKGLQPAEYEKVLELMASEEAPPVGLGSTPGLRSPAVPHSRAGEIQSARRNSRLACRRFRVARVAPASSNRGLRVLGGHHAGEQTWRRMSSSSSALPAPITTELSGSSARNTGRPVSSRSSASR